MPRYFDKVPNRIRDSIDKRREEYREFLTDQKKLRDFRAFHVKPQRIDEITFKYKDYLINI
jgi:hypothetical protein